MYLLFIPLLLVLGLIAPVLLTAPSQPQVKAAQATGQLVQYQVFLSVANRYFASNAAPSSNTAYYWSTLKTVAPPGQANAGIPGFWKAVRTPAGDWVACTEMSEQSNGNVSALYPTQTTGTGTATTTIVPTAVPAASITSVVGSGGSSTPGVTPTYVVIGQTGSPAAVSANLCAGTI